jgi:hypothetical protein
LEAREEAVRRSKQEAEEARAAKRAAALLKAKQEAEAAEKRAREIAERRKQMEDEKRKAAEAAQAARKRATEAAEKEKALRKQQEQRVKDLRQAEAASTKQQADKQQLIAQLERRLQAKIAGCTGSQRFVGILKAFGIPCENNEQATVQKAYRKALIKYHPDKAQRKGEGWQKVAESEEIYKLIQNEWQKYEKQPAKSSYTAQAPSRSPPRRPAAQQYHAPRAQHAPSRPAQPQPQQHYQRYARQQAQGQPSARDSGSARESGPAWKCRVCTKVRLHTLLSTRNPELLRMHLIYHLYGACLLCVQMNSVGDDRCKVCGRPHGAANNSDAARRDAQNSAAREQYQNLQRQARADAERIR